MIPLARRFLPGALLVVAVFALSGAEVQCGSAEARLSLADLQAQIDELRDEFNHLPVVVDSAGKRVGTRVLDVTEGPPLDVLFDLAGFPLFAAPVVVSPLVSEFIQLGQVQFQSFDCSGTGFLKREVFPQNLFIPRAGSGVPVYVAESSDPGAILTVNSGLDSEGNCDIGTETLPYIAAVPVFIWDEEFTPPFEVVTLGDLQP
jgi:hypothetical protein